MRVPPLNVQWPHFSFFGFIVPVVVEPGEEFRGVPVCIGGFPVAVWPYHFRVIHVHELPKFRQGFELDQLKRKCVTLSAKTHLMEEQILS